MDDPAVQTASAAPAPAPKDALALRGPYVHKRTGKSFVRVAADPCVEERRSTCELLGQVRVPACLSKASPIKGRVGSIWFLDALAAQQYAAWEAEVVQAISATRRAKAARTPRRSNCDPVVRRLFVAVPPKDLGGAYNSVAETLGLALAN